MCTYTEYRAEVLCTEDGVRLLDMVFSRSVVNMIDTIPAIFIPYDPENFAIDFIYLTRANNGLYHRADSSADQKRGF